MLKIREICPASIGVCGPPLSKPFWAFLRHWAVGRSHQCQRRPCWAVSHSSHFDFRGQISPSRNCWLQPGLQMQGDCARCPLFYFIFIYYFFGRHPFLCSSKSFVSNTLFQEGSDNVLIHGEFFTVSISPPVLR